LVHCQELSKLTTFVGMKKERITKGKEGYKYESAMYGCYDKGVAPHPEWDVPKEYEVKKAGWKGGKIVKPVVPQYYIASRDKVVIFSATYHPYKDFYLPKEATLISPGGSSAKLSKNKRVSIVLYMSPVSRNSFLMDTCPMASAGCKAACLDYSGQKIPQGNQRLAIARTDFYFAHREAFWERIHQEILKAHKKLKAGDELAVRLNGTSDLPLFKEYCEWCVENDKVKNYPKNILFYDYTKIMGEVTYNKEQELLNPLKRRHKVTYSLSEKIDNRGESGFDKAKKVLMNGGSVAAVFLVKSKGIPEFNSTTGKRNAKPNNWVTMSDGKGGKKYYAPLPETATFEYEGRIYKVPVYDGDSSDDQMLDLGSGKPYILGLRAKARAERDTSGFAIPLFAIDGKPSTDPQIKEFELELRRNENALARACGLTDTPVQRFECPPDQTGKTIKTW
jgi:hypothetical protein